MVNTSSAAELLRQIKIGIDQSIYLKLSAFGEHLFLGPESGVRVSGITRRTPKRKPTTLHNPNTLFLFIILLRKHLNFNLLPCIFIILYFLRI
jgi:hypothetical protein